MVPNVSIRDNHEDCNGMIQQAVDEPSKRVKESKDQGID